MVQKMKGKRKKIILQKRDLEVLGFVAEMKFSLASHVLRAKFQSTKSGGIRTSDFYVKRRLSALSKNGYLKRIVRPDFFEYLYLITPTGFRSFYKLLPHKHLDEGYFPKPSYKLNSDQFHHDLKVIEIRLALEEKWGVRDWVSENKIKMNFKIFSKMKEEFLPDALFSSKSNEVWALEFENSIKAKLRYDQKIQNYSQMIRSGGCPFVKVLYVSEHKSILQLLREKTKDNGDLFLVMDLANLKEQAAQATPPQLEDVRSKKTKEKSQGDQVEPVLL